MLNDFNFGLFLAWFRGFFSSRFEGILGGEGEEDSWRFFLWIVFKLEIFVCYYKVWGRFKIRIVGVLSFEGVEGMDINNYKNF